MLAWLGFGGKLSPLFGPMVLSTAGPHVTSLDESAEVSAAGGGERRYSMKVPDIEMVK